MVDNELDGGVLIRPLARVVHDHEAHRAVLNGGLSVFFSTSLSGTDMCDKMGISVRYRRCNPP